MKKREGQDRHKTHFVELRVERELLFISRRKFVPHLKYTLKKNPLNLLLGFFSRFRDQRH